jgi:hypothetical protein
MDNASAAAGRNGRTRLWAEHQAQYLYPRPHASNIGVYIVVVATTAEADCTDRITKVRAARIPWQRRCGCGPYRVQSKQ